jgi:hypothetical protein
MGRRCVVYFWSLYPALMGMYLTGVHLAGVHLIGVCPRAFQIFEFRANCGN